jgi:hypothetical protein
MACQILSFSSKRPSHIRLTFFWQHLLINMAENGVQFAANVGQFRERRCYGLVSASQTFPKIEGSNRDN